MMLASLHYVDKGNGRRFSRGLDLMLHRASDATLAHRLTLSDRAHEEGTRDNARLIGYDGRQLWLTVDQLYWVYPRQPAPTVFGGDLPKEYKYFSLDYRTRWLRYTALDGRMWQVDPATRQPQPAQPEAPPKDMEEHARFSLSGGVLRTESEYSLTGGQWDETTWLCLMSDREAARENRPGIWWSPPGGAHGETERRRLYRLKVEHSREENNKDYWKLLGVEPVPGATQEYLQGGLLRSLQGPGPLRLQNPDGFLVLHRQRIGKTGTQLMTRIKSDGQPVWSVDTGVATVSQIVPDAATVVVLGQPQQDPRRTLPMPEQMVAVNTATGQVRLGARQ